MALATLLFVDLVVNSLFQDYGFKLLTSVLYTQLKLRSS